MTSNAAHRDIAELSTRAVDELTGWWESEAPRWDDLNGDSRDLLSLLSSLLGSGVSSDAHIDL